MATLVFKDAKVYLDGYDLSGDHNQLALSYEAESLDATVFGNATRVKRGGLRVARATGSGYWQAGANALDPTLFDLLGLDDKVVTVFADGITEGTTCGSGSGFTMKAVAGQYRVGGAVGDLLPFTLEAEGRGIGA